VAKLSARTLDQWQRNGFGPWAAIEKATSRWVGRIGLNELPDWPGPHKVEVEWQGGRAYLHLGARRDAGQWPAAGERYWPVAFVALDPERRPFGDRHDFALHPDERRV
jgi:hypothetical protein